MLWPAYLAIVFKLRRLALRFIHSHIATTGVFWPNCRVVYFQLEAKVTDAISKIDVRRPKVVGLLINYEYIVHYYV